MRVLADFYAALAMKFVRRRQRPRVQIKLRRVTSDTSGRRPGAGAQLFLAKAIKSNHFTAARVGCSDFSRLPAGAGGAACFSSGCGRDCRLERRG